MAVSPNTTFVSGAILTAAQQNNFPRGVMAYQNNTAGFATSAPHTTYQDNGMTLTITEVAGRLYKISYSFYPYPNGGQQSINMRFQRGATTIKDANVFTGMMSTAFAPNILSSATYVSPASGSFTYTVQIAAATANTQVTDFGNATSVRSFWIEDLGPT
jgi:hypothetical protein